MVIAVFIRELSLGGAEKQSLLLTRELQSQSRVFLIVWNGNNVAQDYREFIGRYELEVVFLQGSVPVKLFRMWRFLIREKVTHIINFLLLNNIIGGLTGRLAGVTCIYGGIRNCEIVPSKLMWQKLLHNHVSHKTIFNNHAGAENLSRQGFSKEKMVVIHNGIDLEPEKDDQEQERKQGEGEKKPVILTAARFQPQKDHYTALQAIRELKDRGRNFVYVMAGYGDQEEQIRQWVSDMKLQDSVEIHVSPPDLKNIFRKACVYLSTSLKEGLSNSVMEALAAGLPVVATDVGDNKYLIKEGTNGMLARTGDYEKLADSLEKLLMDRSLCQEMGKNGLQILEKEFSTRRFLDRYITLLYDTTD